MGFHHTAFATRDLAGTHRFYTDVTGFELVKVVVAPTDHGGWAKHVFYEITPDNYLAFWDLHDDRLPDTWSPAISTGQGLPVWVNHVAFRATSLEDIAARRDRWLSHDLQVTEIDHDWCRSIYAVDPNGILVEFCVSTRAMTAADKDEAQRLLADPHPPVGTRPEVVIHQPQEVAAAAG